MSEEIHIMDKTELKQMIHGGFCLNGYDGTHSPHWWGGGQCEWCNQWNENKTPWKKDINPHTTRERREK